MDDEDEKASDKQQRSPKLVQDVAKKQSAHQQDNFPVASSLAAITAAVSRFPHILQPARRAVCPCSLSIIAWPEQFR